MGDEIPRWTLHIDFPQISPFTAQTWAQDVIRVLGLDDHEWHLTSAHDWSIHIKEQP